MRSINYFLTLLIFMGVTAGAMAQYNVGNKNTQNLKKSEFSKLEFKAAVAEYVADEAEKNDGYFIVNDREQNKDLKLRLLNVHNDDVSYLGDNTYFVCSDFRGEDGEIYDVDIFMKGDDAESLVAQESHIHKVNGKERYKWKEVTIWEKEDFKTGNAMEDDQPAQEARKREGELNKASGKLKKDALKLAPSTKFE